MTIRTLIETAQELSYTCDDFNNPNKKSTLNFILAFITLIISEIIVWVKPK